MKKTLSKWNSKLLGEIDVEKNQNIDYMKLGVSSKTKIWWKCSKGHSYISSVESRTRNKGTECPYCANKIVLSGYNDLATLNPDVAKEWDYDKNYPLKPTDVFAKTQKKYYWKCPKGHSYYSSVGNRTRIKSGCPYCANKAVLQGYNDLATTKPELLNKWNYVKNNKLGIKPTEVTGISGKKVW